MGVIVVKPNVNASANSSSLKDTFLNKCAEKQRTCEWINKTFVGGSNALANEIYKVPLFFLCLSIFVVSWRYRFL